MIANLKKSVPSRRCSKCIKNHKKCTHRDPNQIPLSIVTKEKLKNHIVLLLGFKEPLKEEDKKCIQEYVERTINTILRCSKEYKQDTTITIMTFVNYVSTEVLFRIPCEEVSTVNLNKCSGNQLSIFSGIRDCAIHALQMPDFEDPNTSFFVQCLAGWKDTASINKPYSLGIIKRMQDTGRWTFAIQVPMGYATSFMEEEGSFSPDNVLEWEMSKEGFENAGWSNDIALHSYFIGRNLGQKSNPSVYSYPASQQRKNSSDLKPPIESCKV